MLQILFRMRTKPAIIMSLSFMKQHAAQQDYYRKVDRDDEKQQNLGVQKSKAMQNRGKVKKYSLRPIITQKTSYIMRRRE